MTDDVSFSPIGSVRQESARLAGLHANGATPAADAEADARSRLQVARIDREIREAHSKSVAPEPAALAHLVGLLLRWGSVDDPRAVERASSCVREALDVTTAVTDADRMAIAQMILAGGEGR